MEGITVRRFGGGRRGVELKHADGAVLRFMCAGNAGLPAGGTDLEG